MEDYNRMSNAQGRGPTLATPTAPAILDQLASALALLTEKVSSLRNELGAHNEKIMGGRPANGDARTPPPPPSIPIPFGGVIGALGNGVNCLHRELQNLQDEIRQATSI